MKKITSFILCLFLSCSYILAQTNVCQQSKTPTAIQTPAYLMANNSRSDTVDVLKYTISLQITDFIGKTIKGNTQVKFVPKMNGVNVLNLDLLKLIVDSVKLGNAKLVFAYNDTLLKINLPSTKNIGDTSTVTIFYKGTPQIDGGGSGWGGFYFQSGYAYNLGVGFQSNPHVYGRVWFPCFDNFVERSMYEFYITTLLTNSSYCNGALKSDTIGGGFRVRRWVMNQPIPSYLACVAVGAYTEVNQSFSGINGITPIVLAALPADTTKVKSSFINLKNALTIFENRYGAYQWNKVGYSMVPFASGAMEHATNITYPLSFANGSTTYEAGLMAHELSHHWWGDLATCKTEQDMWLNEGWATYSQYIFTESMYGKALYKSGIKANHENVVHYCHVKEGGYLTMNNIPHTYTYGDHVYLKGCDIAHTLRGYMGDSLFFIGVKAYLNNNNYKDATSYTLRDAMALATGYNLNNFFNDWVFNPGFPHFSVDSFSTVPNSSNFDVTVFIRQKLDGAPNYYNAVPIEVTFKYANWTEVIKTVSVSGKNSNFTFTLPMKPVYVGVNIGEKISDATTSDTKVIKATGANFAYNANGRMLLTVNALKDSAFIRVEHNYAAPDPFKTWGKPYKLSPYHYWKVDGILPSLFKATGRIYYDGRTNSTSGGICWLDNTLINASEDSIVLLYRKNTASDWTVFPYYTKYTLANTTDKYGYVIIDSLYLGEYTFAMKDYLSGIDQVQGTSNDLTVYPNPTADEFTLMLPNTSGKSNSTLHVYDLSGRLVYTEEVKQGTASLKIRTSQWKNGTYLLSLESKEAILGRKKMIVQH